MDNFEDELTNLLNRYSIDTKCNTHDYVLAHMIKRQLNIFVEANLLEEKAKGEIDNDK